ncbi:MAG: 2-isopropylmalate synthase [Clostridium perfringens]|nr:2-isopropylmalate synthase [Clostridium perfringens]
MSKKIKIFDTTLRDGEQTPGVNLNVKEKILIAKQLENLSVDVIEAGFPRVSKGEFQAVSLISKEIKSVTVAALCRATKEDIECAKDALKYAKNPRIHTFIATSNIHMQHKLNMSPEKVLEKAYDAVLYSKKFCNDVEFSAEDAYRSDKDFLCRVLEEVIRAGATVVNIPDTVGYALPMDYYSFIKYIVENTKGIEKVDLSVHCHDDLGMAVANSISGIMAGASQIECAINGIGERAGNAALEEVVMAIDTRKNFLSFHTDVNTRQLYNTSKLVSSITGVDISKNKSVVGKNVFSHESGIHQDGILKEKSTYEIMTPESIGIKNSNEIVLGKHSGKHALIKYLDNLDIKLSDEEVSSVFNKFKEIADKKKIITEKDIEAIVNSKKYFNEVYKLKSYQINSGNNIICTCAIELFKDNKILTEVATGRGTIDSAFKSIERILGFKIDLKDYFVTPITFENDALGEATVKITKDNKIFTGKDISQDVIEASIKAYINAINKMIEER